MRKKLICMLLCAGLLLSFACPVLAEEPETSEEEAVLTEETEKSVFLEISTREEFLAFAERCRLDSYSVGLIVTLKKDIDLSGTDFSGIPIFSGVFYGDGHRISGLEITAEGSAKGLFRYLTNTAFVSGLTVEGTIAPGGSGSQVGAIAGENEGTIKDCIVIADVSGSSSVGGIAGVNGITGIVEDCAVEGKVNGAHFVGGIAGENLGVIRGCKNRALINTEARENTVELSEITLDTITNSEASNTATDIGGIAGLSSGLIRDCENVGDVGYPHMGYNVGGIAGTQSGHIADCVNRASIQGRKEVGGITGQMEPIAYVEFSIDTLQILKEQLGTMSGLVDKASANAGGSAGAMSGQIGALQNQANTAWDAVETLLSTDITDTDAILAAQNTLTSALGEMPGTVQRIGASAQAMVSGLSRDFKIISEHIAVMGETLNEASENLGGSVTDISDLDTDELLSGKLLSCSNRGDVLGDLNVGGIAGAMGFENDMDILEDWASSGETSLNFDSKIRAVVLDCRNYASVTGSKQNIGGLVGWQSLGLVRNSVNTGSVNGSGADNVGGVSGFSLGYIRSCGAKCEIQGDTCVGGVAGSATVVSDSVAYVIISGTAEKAGAILGIPQEADEEQEQPISGNYYVPVNSDIGAVDGISYSGQAEPLTLEEFLALEHLPYGFGSVTVRFEFEDGSARELVLAPGTALAEYRIPQVPKKAGYSGQWEGLSEVDLSNVLFDMTFRLSYTGYSSTIRTAAEAEENYPILLAEGSFGLDAVLDVIEPQEGPALSGKETLLALWQPQLTGEAEAAVLRFLRPEAEAKHLLKLYVQGKDGQWNQRTYDESGSYLVFSWSEEDVAFAVIGAQPDRTLWYVGGAGAAVLIVGIVILLLYKKRKKASPDAGKEEN